MIVIKASIKEKGNTERIRTRYTDREEHYKKEFYAICKQQRLSEEQISKLEKALYFQRPLKSQRQGVGKCTFEPKKSRVADSHPSFELFRMLSFVNNIKVKGPHDVELRPLTTEEFEMAKPAFFRKSKPQFDFEDIAKAIAGKGKYQYIKEIGEKPYKFNYRMSQSVTGCPTIANLMSLFGDDYEEGIAERYTLSEGKTPKQMLNDVWNVLYSFSDKDKVKQWGKEKLQLSDEEAEKFSKIRLTHAFASLSLAAINNILPWLEQGLIYPHAVLMAKVPDIVGEEVWKSRSEAITKELLSLISNFNPKDIGMTGTLDFCIKDILKDMCDLAPGAVEKLYHPSMIEAYPDAKKNSQGIYQLGSPRTNAIRNPMAMRSLHQLRKVINTLLQEGTIDNQTEVHIEYARELNDANKRKAIAQWNKDRENKRKKYAEDIRSLYKQESGKAIEPTEDDIVKFQLWEEQNHICLYTGESIGITDFIGPNPSYDIEHTVPRSVGGDSTLENMTLCSSKFNRDVKKAKLPTELPNHDDILGRLEGWRGKIEKLRKDADHVKTYSSMDKATKDRLIQKRHLIRLELDYWVGKYKRFQMEEVPEGFARRQGAGIGLVGKYAGLYLKSLFHKADDRSKSNVRVVKGATTAEYRKMWGIQDEYVKKSRDNHVHHCIDAITIACIEPGEYNATARYYQQLEEYERNNAPKPSFPKPWPTFTEDIKAIAQEMLVVHSTPDNMPKRARKYVQTSNGRKLAMGDSARGSLHNDTYYGAIERDGEIKYVVRKTLSSLKETDIENIVDDAVKERVKNAVAEKGFKEAMAGDIFMNEMKGIKIKKVRCFTPADGRRKTTKTDERRASESLTTVRPPVSRQTGASHISPVSAFHNSGTRPDTRKYALNSARPFPDTSPAATKYQSAASLRRWIHEISAPFASCEKSGARPIFFRASGMRQGMTPFAHVFAASALTRLSPSGRPESPECRLGRVLPQTFAPFSTSAPMHSSISSLIVSVSGSARSAYSAPPGETMRPPWTFRFFTAFVAAPSQSYPAGAPTPHQRLSFGVLSPFHRRMSEHGFPSWSIHWQRAW